MQYQILIFLQNFSSDAILFIANLLSFAGEETFLILILLTIYYTVDKRAGFSIFSSLLCAQTMTNAIKSVVRAPRPFMVHESLSADRIETATGYSFPSGHTAGAAAFYPALGRESGKKSIVAVTIILAVLIGLSRNILAVHWPVDVLVGLIIGLVFSLAMTRLFDRIWEDRKRRFLFSSIMGSSSALISIILCTVLSLSLVDEMAYSDLMKILSLSAGAYGGAVLEMRMVNFSTENSLLKKVLSVLIAMAVAAAIMFVREMLPETLYYPGALAGYALLGLWATGLFPLIAVKTSLMKKDASDS